MSWFKKKDVCPHANEDGTVELDESCFDDFIKSNPKVMVMFYRTTCSHSVNMIPVYAEVSNDLKDKMKFCRVSTPTNMPLVKKYEVKSTPTFMIFNDGKASASIVGEKTKDFLKGEIERSFAQ
jgi:thioredoxin 1